MNLKSFLEFQGSLVLEALHPELQEVAADGSGWRSKQNRMAAKIRELTKRGEKTGIENNMPKGSSRAFLIHTDQHPVEIDGKATTMPTGTKVAIRSHLDPHHDHAYYGGSLGQLQNRAENADGYINRAYRVLHEEGNTGKFKTNDEGIFPPLVDHDWDNDEWSHVGVARNVGAGEFRELTKTPEFPKGISHSDFVRATVRNHLKTQGRYWGGGDAEEARLDKINEHPLVQQFNHFHTEYGSSPADYAQKKNMGVWEHPVTGKKYIVARDHGFGSDVEQAYGKAMRKKYAARY